MQEIDLEKLKTQMPKPSNTSVNVGGSSMLNGELPYKRIQINHEEMKIMESALSEKMLDEAPQEAAQRPTTQAEAKVGVGGYKLDQGKPRWELAPFDAFEAMVHVQTWAVDKNIRGDKAYPERNWERGMAWSRVFGAMIRHAWKWWMGKMTGRSTVDEESGMSHIWHAFTCAGFLVAYELRNMDEFDDRPSVPADKQPTTK